MKQRLRILSWLPWVAVAAVIEFCIVWQEFWEDLREGRDW